MAKLVEILARELKEWPENFPHAHLSQSVSGRVAYVINNKERMSVGDFDKADDWLDALVDKREWQAAVDALKTDAQRFAEDYVEANKDRHVKEWDGVGLPPVGTLCEFRAPDEYEDPFLWRPELRQGARVEIIYRYDTGVSDVAVFKFDVAFGQLVEQAGEGCFRPIRTPEQIAAEDIAEIAARIGIAGDSIRCLAEAIVKAGYRKQEPK